VDNTEVAQVFGDIADLLEIKGENAFKIRAYRTAADTIKAWGDPVARMDDGQLRALPGIGKDLAAKIRELAETGTCGYHRDLLQEFPPTILDLLRLQGVGPKTVAVLYGSLNIRTVEELDAAARGGRLRELKGMGPKKEALILKAIDERQKDAGRHLLAETAAQAEELIAYLQERFPGAELIPVGSLRRGCETCGDIDILAIGGSSASPGTTETTLMDFFVAYPKVERILGQGDTKSSVRLRGGFQADLRLVPPDSRGAAMQYFTGSKAHNILLRDRAIGQGFKLNEYGLFRNADDVKVAGSTEESIYDTLGLAWVDPALRENHGELQAAAERRLPHLVGTADIRGDLHMHTTATDGRDDIDGMAAAALERGYEYIAITDHSRALAMANGLDEERALTHAAAVRERNGRFGRLTLLAGIECDILPDGRLDLADDCLAQLDIVIASVHSHFSQDEAQMTDRILRALENPWVDVLGHPTARLLLKREPIRIQMDAVIAAAAGLGVALEINSQVNLPRGIARLDLNDAHARIARDRGVRLVISTDAHSATALDNMRWGLSVARRAWVEAGDVLNTRPLSGMRALLRRNRKAA
jgi:DNA polymerase (family 10)